MTYPLLSARSARSVRESPGAVADMTPAKLLLIDDDSRLTSMVGDYLRGHGFDVDTAASLNAGRDRLRGGLYDALVHPDLLKFCQPSAERVFVGKRAGRPHERQAEINQRLRVVWVQLDSAAEVRQRFRRAIGQ